MKNKWSICVKPSGTGLMYQSQQTLSNRPKSGMLRKCQTPKPRQVRTTTHQSPKLHWTGKWWGIIFQVKRWNRSTQETQPCRQQCLSTMQPGSRQEYQTTKRTEQWRLQGNTHVQAKRHKYNVLCLNNNRNQCTVTQENAMHHKYEKYEPVQCGMQP